MLQDYFENYIDVSVGKANKVDPRFLIEEKLEYLIIGDIISETMPSREIQNWLLNFGENSRKNNLILKALSCFYVTLNDIQDNTLWIEFFQENINAEIIYPPIICLKQNSEELFLEKKVLNIIRKYSNDFIEILLYNKKKE